MQCRRRARDTFGAILPIHFASAADAAKLTPTGVTSGPITSADALFSKLAQALELPGYFGHNWDALDECLREVLSDMLAGARCGDGMGTA